MQLQGKEGTELVLGYPCLPDGILGWGTAQGFHTQAPGSKVPWRVWGSCSQADDTGLPGWRRRLRGRPALGRLGKGTPPRARQQQACSQAAGRAGERPRAHQLVVRPHLGLVLPAPLVPLLQLGHHGLALLGQDLLVFNQLWSGGRR